MRLAMLVFSLLLLAPSLLWAQDMPLRDLLIEGEDWVLVAEGYKFTEGPAVDPAGNLYFTDVPNSKILKVEMNNDGAEGEVSTFVEESGRTNGLMFGPDGRLYGCRNGERQIAAWSADGAMTVLAEDVDSNDLVVNSAGGVYFTDPKGQQVWYLDPQGKKQVVDKGLTFPNGLILWPDEQTLVVDDTRGEHLWNYRIGDDGKLSVKQPYSTMQLPPGRTDSGADGMTVDSRGRVYVATHAGVQVFDTQGRLSGVIAKPQSAFLSNVVFAGPQLDQLVATCTDKVFRRKVNAQGIRYGAAK
ncbi:MAG: SMP-30/gluconolactonase/LRE family protein [Pirellulaceae bacterium]